MVDNSWISYTVSELKCQPPPAPWQRIDVAIAALREVGYAQNSDLLLVISEAGRGVFNCLTGEKVARDRNHDDTQWRDPIHLTAQGIGPLNNQTIRLAGISGGGLRTLGSDGWSLMLVSPYWPLESVVLFSSNRILWSPDGFEHCTKIYPPGDGDKIRAYGFSDTNKSFIVATPNTLALFSRP
ncbi:MAG: hypothetical protein K8S97_12950 [Anaerolineae bacterium]|nr:hypothetical protein [Anaerolineae bacterium]